MDSTAARECGAKEQTAEYIITTCPIYHHLNEARAHLDVNKSQVTWLTLVDYSALVHLQTKKKKNEGLIKNYLKRNIVLLKTEKREIKKLTKNFCNCHFL